MTFERSAQWLINGCCVVSSLPIATAPMGVVASLMPFRPTDFAKRWARAKEGYFNATRLDGLNYVMLLQWPGEIAQGNGTQQIFIDAQADALQREALRKILHGEATAPGSTHFFVFNSTMSNVLEPQFVPIDLSIDVEARQATVNVPGLVESKGTPISNPHTGRDHRARIHLPEGFEYTVAEVGNGSTRAQAGIALNLSNNGQFNLLHMNQDGVIRA